MRRGVPFWVMASGAGLLGLLAASLPALAQQTRATVAESRIVVRFEEAGNDTVEATYTIQGTAALSDGAVQHLLVSRPGTQVEGLRAAGAAAGMPEIGAGDGIRRIRVVVSGEPATYTLRYTVRRETGVYAVPIPTPALPAASSAANVTIETYLPPGQRLAGEVFPSVSRRETREGRAVLVHRVINIPSTVIAEYGERRRLTDSDWISLISLVVFGSVVAVWYRQIRR